ncbi:MAG: Gfo/Idh/MocA family oxidoreductase [Edaphobacter sp.]|uniref:Gfo/Idh/MocA family protein n=1 Tax=Edaphobacter sp. TaxID=1934404 RepID=UPI0023A0FC3E|nr:Gfo/Idh/MocA family oxidoreductase [Edaphobacter sp.]MDE1175754.1 Gfo/Idh/MocA family oxidoreductase [Edaphobacter sp.]
MAETKLNRRLRLGMVGGGPGAFIGAVHRVAARLDDRYELVAASLSSDATKSAEAARDLFVARSYTTYAAMAQAEAAREDGIDVVAIVTPNHLHYPIAKAFLEAGIHVICDKPMTINVAEAEELVTLVQKTGLIFGLTHTYTGYPMIRQIREMVLGGELGAIRMIQSEYAQDWLATPLEQTGAKQADWRTDPARSGPGGCLGDIGTHAFHLACFTTGLTCEQLAADVTTFVPGRRVDDNIQVMLRLSNGAKAGLWASQIAVGEENDLSLRIYGEKGGLTWRQEDPNHIVFTPLKEQPRIITRGGPGISAASTHATRLPSGHPEGYFEAFAQLYTDIADQITARILQQQPPAVACLVPGVEDGLTGMRFVDAVLRSAKNNSAWTSL